MKKILTVLATSLGLLACQGCSKDNTSTKPPVVASLDPVNQKVSFDKMTITIPIGWIKLGERETIAAYASKHKKTKLLMTKELCQEGYTACVLAAIQSMKDSGIQIESVSSIDTTHGQTVSVVSSVGMSKVYSWFYYKNNVVYMLACGGELGLATQATCNEINNSVFIQ